MIWHGCKSEQCKCSYNASEIHFAFRGLRKVKGACLSATSKCSETKKGVLCLSCLRLFDLEPIAPAARQGSGASSALLRLWGLPATVNPAVIHVPKNTPQSMEMMLVVVVYTMHV